METIDTLLTSFYSYYQEYLIFHDLMFWPYVPRGMVDHDRLPNADGWMPYRFVRSPLGKEQIETIEKEINHKIPLPVKQYLCLNSNLDMEFGNIALMPIPSDIRSEDIVFYFSKQPYSAVMLGLSLIQIGIYDDEYPICVSASGDASFESPVFYFDGNRCIELFESFSDMINKFTVTIKMSISLES